MLSNSIEIQIRYNGYMKRWLIILTIVLLALTALFALWEYMTAPAELISMTKDECIQKGGSVANTWGKNTWNEKDVIGQINNMNCPCLCIKTSNNTGMFLLE